ncbi:MAG: CaiB/BaiF CoA transferase family protein [Acidimicrobiales bacterium]
MEGPLTGIKVVEVASWSFVPAAGAVLAEWGADVVKVERLEGGDPQRGLVATGVVPEAESGVDYLIEQPNHAKRSLAVDLKHPEGRQVVLDLCAGADVFLTNWLPGPRRRARIDVDDIRAVNPGIIYVRGTGQGVRGPDAERGGYDGSAFWARAGTVDQLTSADDPYGPTQPPAFGDLIGGQTIAGGIAAALYRRAATGTPSVVDVSLMAVGMWMMSPGIVSQRGRLGPSQRPPTREEAPNPVANRYRTRDGRVVHLVMLQAGRFWPELVRAVGRPALADDPRFADAEALRRHHGEARAVLEEVFAARTLAEWRSALASVEGVWAVAQTPAEVHDDAQATANGYLAEVAASEGPSFRLVANPVQFDESPPVLRPAPSFGEHTDEILGELGLDTGAILALKIAGAVL